MTINTDYLNRCIQTLQGAFEQLQKHPANELSYDIYCAACVKEFEIIMPIDYKKPFLNIMSDN